MKYLRRTDKKYLPLHNLLNPVLLGNKEYYREADYSRSDSNSFSRDLERGLADATAKNERQRKAERKKQENKKLKAINSRLCFMQCPSSPTSTSCTCWKAWSPLASCISVSRCTSGGTS
jgi:hypothetical protein